MRGFTLLESLVALVILSLILAASYRIFSGGLLGIGRGEQRMQMALIAEGVLGRVRLGEELERGNAGTYRWVLTRNPFEPEAGFATGGSLFTQDDGQGAPEWRLDEVVVTVRNSADDQFELRSLMLVEDDE